MNFTNCKKACCCFTLNKGGLHFSPGWFVFRCSLMTLKSKENPVSSVTPFSRVRPQEKRMEKKYDEKCFPHRWSSSPSDPHSKRKEVITPDTETTTAGLAFFVYGPFAAAGRKPRKAFFNPTGSLHPAQPNHNFLSKPRVSRARPGNTTARVGLLVPLRALPPTYCWHPSPLFLSCILFHPPTRKGTCAHTEVGNHQEEPKQTGQRNYTEKEHSTGVAVAAIGLCRFCHEFEYPPRGGLEEGAIFLSSYTPNDPSGFSTVTPERRSQSRHDFILCTVFGGKTKVQLAR